MPAELTPGPIPQSVVLEGRAVRVRPLEIARDAEPLFRTLDGPDLDRIYRYLPVPPPSGLADLTAQLRQWQSQPAVLQFLFEDKSGKAAGTSSFMRIVPEHRVLEVGFVVMAPWAQRSILATEAQYLLARHVFEDLGYRRYEWKCDDRNEPSKAAALRLGFRYEGTFRRHMIIKGRSRDTAWYAMTDAEWPAVKSALERWLAPDNFDADGRQRASLAVLRA